MTNPFDNKDGSFFVLVNGEEQYSLWPDMFDIPAGWSVEFGPASLDAATEYVDANWTDMRPKRLREAMAAAQV